MRQQVAIYSDALALRGQRVQGQLEPGLVVHGHAGLLHQLVRNLLGNAHRYSPEGSLIRVRVFRKGRQVFLEVRDEGPGICAEHLPQVFDRFWRACPHRSDGGSGMGLAIAARICRAHGGNIRVTSVAGCGSRFEVELPLLSGSRWPRFTAE